MDSIPQNGSHEQLPLFPEQQPKICSCCKQPYPPTIEYFHKQPRSKDGLCHCCKGCKNAKERLFREQNPERVAEKNRRYRRNNPEAAQESSRKWRETNNDRKREINREWVENNRDKVRGYHKRWRQRHPDKARGVKQRRRAREYNAQGSHTLTEVQTLYTHQQGKCFHCGINISEYYEEDHWIPLTRGGSDYIENIRLLCKPCNNSKYNKLPHEWCPEKYSPLE